MIHVIHTMHITRYTSLYRAVMLQEWHLIIHLKLDMLSIQCKALFTSHMYVSELPDILSTQKTILTDSEYSITNISRQKCWTCQIMFNCQTLF